MIIDINGYFATSGALQFYSLTPCRVLDTRNPGGTFGGPTIAGGTSRSFPIPASTCGVPAAAAAYSFNTTVVPSGSLGYLTAWPTGSTQPFVSTLNSLDGTILANAAIVPAGTAGAVSFFASNTTHLIVDINGYFAAPGDRWTGLPHCRSMPDCGHEERQRSAGWAHHEWRNHANVPSAIERMRAACKCGGILAEYDGRAIRSAGILNNVADRSAQPLVSTLNAPKGFTSQMRRLYRLGTSGSVNAFVTIRDACNYRCERVLRAVTVSRVWIDARAMSCRVAVPTPGFARDLSELSIAKAPTEPGPTLA